MNVMFVQNFLHEFFFNLMNMKKFINAAKKKINTHKKTGKKMGE